MGKPHEERPTDPTDAAAQRRKERAAPTGGAGGAVLAGAEATPEPLGAPKAEAHRHREEVVGQGSGETAGGSPAIAAGESATAKRTATPDPAIEFDPAKLGGVSSNTPPSIPKGKEKELSAGGEDTVEISLYLLHSSPSLFPSLDRAREAAESGDKGRDELTRDGFRMLCLPGSGGAGSAGKRINYRWRLQSETGLELLLMQRATPHKTLANGRARFGSIPLMRFGLHGCWDELLRWLKVLGAKLERNKLGRIDPCVDLADCPVEIFSLPFRRQEYVSRARDAGVYAEDLVVGEFDSSRRTRGFKIGGKQVLLRVYDKHRESRFASEKRVLLLDRRWGYFPDTATRVEFQLRREALKRYGIDGYEDWLTKRATVVDKLSLDWFRLVEGPLDRKHPKRSAVLPEWLEVRRAFADWAGDSVGVELTPVPRGEANAELLRKQLYGLTQSVLARCGRPVGNLDEFAHEGTCLLLELSAGRDVAFDYQRKVLELGLGEGA